MGSFRTAVLAIALGVFFALPVVTWSQETGAEKTSTRPAESKVDGAHQPHGHTNHGGHDEDHDGARGHVEGQHHEMMAKCMEGKEKMQKAVADMKAMDDRLDEKLAVLKSAQGEQKIGAMEAVLVELVAQRKEMREKMGALGQHPCMCCMKGGMGYHGKMGGMCPMMQTDHGTGAQAGDSNPAKPAAKKK